VDEEAEFEAWKIRELLRIKRDKEERIAYVELETHET
jgi:microfibrillar-associated protein 1